MSTQTLTADQLWKEIEVIINKSIEKLAQEQIEEQVNIFREKLIEKKSEVVIKVLAKVFEMYDRFWQELIIKIPINK